MTDDGAFANLLTHPSGGVGKLYRVTVRPPCGPKNRSSGCPAALCWTTALKRPPAVIHVVSDEPGRTVLGDHAARGPQPPDPPHVRNCRPRGHPPSSAAPKARSSWACCRRANGGSSTVRGYGPAQRGHQSGRPGGRAGRGKTALKKRAYFLTFCTKSTCRNKKKVV